MIPVKLTTPANTSSPALTFLGNVSPVKLEVSKVLSPFNTNPSRGTFSPTLITISSPILIFSGATLIISSPTIRLA